jgi:hypothetical protein
MICCVVDPRTWWHQVGYRGGWALFNDIKEEDGIGNRVCKGEVRPNSS